MGVSLSLLFLMALIMAADMIPRMEIICRLTRPKGGACETAVFASHCPLAWPLKKAAQPRLWPGASAQACSLISMPRSAGILQDHLRGLLGNHQGRRIGIA